jgi:hypothetical protein
MRDRNYLQGKDQQSLTGQTAPQVRTVTYNDEAAPLEKEDLFHSP